MVSRARTPFPDDALADAAEGLPINAKYSLNFLREAIFGKVKFAARRAPSQTVKIAPVDPDLKLFFESFEETSELWDSIPTADADAATWYSPYFQAGLSVTSFDSLPASVNSSGDKIAAGPLFVFPAGDACVAVPPWLVEFIPKKGPDGQVLWHELKVTFQLGVVPASRGTTARFRLSESTPPFSKNNWIFLPEFASLEAHCQEHIKKVCLQHQPRPNAASMRAAAVWVVDPNPMPNQYTRIRACEKTGKAGKIWWEARCCWLNPTDSAHKSTVLRSNEQFRVNRVSDWSAAREEARLLAVEEKKAEIHRQKRAADDRGIRRRKKRERTGEDLAEDDDALDYSDTDHLTQSETEWLEAQHARARRGF